MGGPVTADQFIEAARRATGLERFDSDSFREGLEILIADKTRPGQPELTEPFRQFVISALANRLKVTAALDERPELLERAVERPVFVFGLPRTGTTLLNNLLAADPARRSALTWEIDDPVPPPTSATLTSDPRAVARLEQHRALLAAHPEAGRIYRGSPVYPNECLFFTRSDFKSLICESTGSLPTYRDWLFQTDMGSTYAYHKRFLQLHQADAPGIWNLKQPSHGLWLDSLLQTYPDARLVWTHRDPVAALGSFCSLTKVAHQAFSGPVDLAWIAQNQPWQALQHANRPLDWIERNGGERIAHVHYADLIRDPIPAMRRLYAALGDDFTPEAEAAMRAWLADNPQAKFGKHEYRLDEYGLTASQVRGLFECYLSCFDIEPEGV
ncbi:sulfotransferase family protein [Novosphingobium bradum]|uniref:Sulfotransferase family protein n=1 Tax=Novosphingobium bradum TaxID=1737444 RepID=A0ABV7IPK1_9SPHN